MASVRPGTAYRDLGGRLRRIRPSLEYGAPPRKRMRRDVLARALDAAQYTREATRERGRSVLYVPRDATMLGVADALRGFVRRGFVRRLPGSGQSALLLARVVFADLTAEWRSTSFVSSLELALSVGAAALTDWAHGAAPSSQRMKASGKHWRTDYAGARVASLEIAYAGEAEVLYDERARQKRRSKAIRRKESRDRKRGTRTTRGR